VSWVDYMDIPADTRISAELCLVHQVGVGWSVVIGIVPLRLMGYRSLGPNNSRRYGGLAGSSPSLQQNPHRCSLDPTCCPVRRFPQAPVLRDLSSWSRCG